MRCELISPSLIIKENAANRSPPGSRFSLRWVLIDLSEEDGNLSFMPISLSTQFVFLNSHRGRRRHLSPVKYSSVWVIARHALSLGAVAPTKRDKQGKSDSVKQLTENMTAICQSPSRISRWSWNKSVSLSVLCGSSMMCWSFLMFILNQILQLSWPQFVSSTDSAAVSGWFLLFVLQLCCTFYWKIILSQVFSLTGIWIIKQVFVRKYDF